MRIRRKDQMVDKDMTRTSVMCSWQNRLPQHAVLQGVTAISKLGAVVQRQGHGARGRDELSPNAAVTVHRLFLQSPAAFLRE